ncbi:MAG: hypothetical protein H8D45_26405, partial [Bacteroidetes bacterium]|nr:hypothetical protein [Bacteroidota bacterium]
MKRKIKNILVAVQQRNLLSYIPTTIFTVVAAVISIPILTRWFTPEIYGKYALVLAGISLSTTLGGGWLYQSILRYYTGELETGEWRLFFKLSLLGSLVIVSFSIPLWYIFVEFRDYSIAASLFIFLCIPFRTINVMDRVEEHPFRYSIWDSGLNAGKLLLGI